MLDQHKFNKGWQEPGLWRPKWIVERYFEDEEGNFVMKDKFRVQLKSDKSIKIYRSSSRPWLEIFKRKDESQKTQRKKKLFETGDEMQNESKEAKAKESTNGESAMVRNMF